MTAAIVMAMAATMTVIARTGSSRLTVKPNGT
jgi:hypothetical protein